MKPWIAAVGLAAVIAAGCGGGGDDDSSAPTAAVSGLESTTTEPSSPTTTATAVVVPLTKAQYEQKLNSFGSSLDASFTELNTMFQGATPKEGAADKIAEIQTQMRTFADDLDKVAPPEDVMTDHEQLVEGLRDYADDLDEFRKAAEDESVHAIETFVQSLDSESVTKVHQALGGLKEKGYNVVPML